MANSEELFNAVRLIKEHCRNRTNRCECYGCPLYVSIDVGCVCRSIVPGCWPDLEEGSSADVRFMNKTEIDGNELFKRIAGHSYYKGDDILTRISLMQEGKIPKKDIESADVRPVVHGKWENTGSDVWKCSICGYGVMPWNAGINYCPNCGADMRKEGDSKDG